MPIFIWIAIAIAILLIGGGAATAIVAKPVADAVNGPLGYIVALGIVAILVVIVWNKTRNTNQNNKDL
jgi:purine-cytosine permease-like protein